MARIISDVTLKKLLDEAWVDLACFAYEHYRKYGRGFVGIDDNPEKEGDFIFIYATAGDESKFDEKIKTCVRNYDPESGMVLHFACAPGLFRTISVKAPEQDMSPKHLWETFNGLVMKSMKKNEN